MPIRSDAVHTAYDPLTTAAREMRASDDEAEPNHTIPQAPTAESFLPGAIKVAISYAVSESGTGAG